MALTQTQVSQLYISIFGRASEGAGNTYWQATADMATAANTMLATSAAATYFGTSLDDNAAFIKHIYLNTLGKTYAQDTAGVDYWVTQLATQTRGEVVAALVYAAQQPANAGAAQDMFNNKVAVSNYCADNIETADIADLSAFTGYISGVTDDDATVTTAESDIDADTAATVPASYTLTAATNIIESTGADTFTATSATFNALDIISDNATTDNDTMNITATAAITAQGTVTNVENINVTLDYFTGTTASIDATNITGATITLGSTKLGYNGIAGVAVAGTNNVTAGTNVTALTVAGTTTGTINTGSATSADLTTTGTSKVIVNGDLSLDLTTAATKTTTIEVTAAAEIDLAVASTIASDVVVAGAHNVTFTQAEELSALDVTNDLTAGTLVAVLDTTAGAVNAGNWDVDSIQVAKTGFTVTTANAAAVELTTAAMTTIFAGSAATNTLNVTTAQAQTAVTFGTLAEATLNVTAAKTITTLTTTATDLTTLHATAATTVSTLAAGSLDVAVTGTAAVTVTTGNAASVDASALTGAFTYTTTTTADISGSHTAANAVTVNAAAITVGYTGGLGVDTVTATALVGAGTLATDLMAGNDVVKLAGSPVGTFAIDGGADTDTLWLTNATDTTGATITLANMEKIELQNITTSAADTVAATVDSSMISGKAYTILTAEAADTATLNVTVDGTSVNLSTLTMSNIDSVVIAANTTATSIIGSSTADSITVGAATSVTGGAGDDVFTFVTGDSTAAALTAITDYQAAAAASNNDTLTLVNGSVSADDAVGADVKAVTGTTGTVTATIVDGFLALAGLSADKATFDTVAEWVNAGETIADGSFAFVLNGNTYVVDFDGTDTTPTTAIDADNVIQLTGLTTATAVDTTAAANTILIA